MIQPPQMQPPQMQAPQMQAPQMQAPQMQPPQMQAPQMQAPQMQPPQPASAQPPQMQPPQMQPQMQAPQMQPPQMQAPQPPAPVVAPPAFGAVAPPGGFAPPAPVTSQPPAFQTPSAPAAPAIVNQAPTVPPAGSSAPPRGASHPPAQAGASHPPVPSTPVSAPVPSPLPSSKRVDQPPVDASQAQEHRVALAKLVERTSAAVDLSSLANGEAPDAARLATVDRALREKAASMRAANEIPTGLDPEVLVAEAKRELVELGPLGPLLEDEDVEEVQVIRHDYVVALHGRRQIATEIAFTSEQALARVVRRICVRAGAPLSPSEQFVERRLERGGRMFGVLPPTSGTGHMLVFRKPQRALLSLDDLVRSGTISRAMATLFAQCVAGRANILVAGAHNSGATALLGALAGAGGIEDRVVVLQEDDELIFNQPHTVSILIGDTAEEGARAVRAAIRVRPDRLVVGAFAGHVVAEVVDAVGDGVDGVLAAARAPTMRHLVQRVPADLAATRNLASVDTAREWVAAAFDLVVEVARLRDGRQRVMRVAELGFKDGHRELVAHDIFTFTVERTAAGGSLEGSFHATGHVPRVVEELAARGTNLDMAIFKR
jgi:pilus assembly protein CpaF